MDEITWSTKMATKLNVEDIRRITEEYRQLNSMNVQEIEFYENGEKVEIAKKWLDDWLFTGLGVSYFIESNFYKEGWQLEPETTS